MTREELYDKARMLPVSPGVYLMKNKAGRVIYVGKSKALRNRVSSYFAPFADHVDKTLTLVQTASDFEIYYTKTELEALILESQFVRQYHPRFNILLQDNNGYPYIRLKIKNGEFPRFDIDRRRKDAEKHQYFGPFSSYNAARAILDMSLGAFKLPTCKKVFPRDIGKTRPCLNYHIGKCFAPCVEGRITGEEYKKLCDGAIRLIKGDHKALLEMLESEMEQAAEALNFELAAKHRDSIASIKNSKEKQQIVTSSGVDADVLHVYTDEMGSCLVIFFVRDGAITDREHFFFGADELIDSASLTMFLYRLYELREYVPNRVYTGFLLEESDSELMTLLFHEKFGVKSAVLTPKRGDMKAITDHAYENAKNLVEQKRINDARHNDILTSLAELLRLEVIPDRIEAYDISNHGDSIITCGMIVISKGRFEKKKYRTFNIKSIEAQDDYASLREALGRRFSHSADETGWEYPDMLLLDGGAGHVSAAQTVLEEKGIDIPIFGMVKDEHHKTRTLLGPGGEITLNTRQDIFVFIYKIQEEVHRFSFARMDNQRRKTVKRSSLTSIKGVGEAKAKALLTHFGTYSALRQATEDEIAQVKGIDKALAAEIREWLSQG